MAGSVIDFWFRIRHPDTEPQDWHTGLVLSFPRPLALESKVFLSIGLKTLTELVRFGERGSVPCEKITTHSI